MTGTKAKGSRHIRIFSILLAIALISGLLILSMVLPSQSSRSLVMVFAGMTLTLSLLGAVWISRNPDAIRASQTDEMLRLADKMLACMHGGGLDFGSAEEICRLLLPATSADAVAITDTTQILSYMGLDQHLNQPQTPIKTSVTLQVIADGESRIVNTAEEIGFPDKNSSICGAIVVPIKRRSQVVGTLKFYYNNPNKIGETQISIAEGFGRLISSLLASAMLEEQERLATTMELKMLQSQINPHFLFNTINTIASLVRTDPNTARNLLREFAQFYRRTLEDSADLIKLEREIDQVKRYFMFETARFGESRLEMKVDMAPGTESVLVPAFMIQPLVENAVRHGRPSSGKLNILVYTEVEGEDLIVYVEDDGIGMEQETLDNILNAESSTGMGIAVKNVHDRIVGFFGPNASMEYESAPDQGTCVTLTLKGAAKNLGEEAPGE